MNCSGITHKGIKSHFFKRKKKVYLIHNRLKSSLNRNPIYSTYIFQPRDSLLWHIMRITALIYFETSNRPANCNARLAHVKVWIQVRLSWKAQILAETPHYLKPIISMQLKHTSKPKLLWMIRKPFNFSFFIEIFSNRVKLR